MGEWKGKRVIVIGAARQGVALARFLVTRGASIVMNDQKSSEQLEPIKHSLAEQVGGRASQIEWVTGSHPVSLLDGVEAVCVSGGVPLTLPLIQEANNRAILLTNDSQILLEECPGKTIGITGSAGKTTTTSLVGKIAETYLHSSGITPIYRKIWVGGNIGSPLLPMVDEMHADDLVVIELSSFQLELMTSSVDIACILNITPNHLDRHANMEAYTAAKQRILDFQEKNSIAVIGADDPGSWAMVEKVKGLTLTFGRDKSAQDLKGAYIKDDWICLWDGHIETNILRQSEIPLRGWHNVENVLAAAAISLAAGIPESSIREGVTSFEGVPHRLEWVMNWKGADWYNDSIATAPERVIAAIHSFDTPAGIQRPIVLLLGGRDKNLPWSELVDLIKSRVRYLILFGEAADKIYSEVSQGITDNPLTSLERFNGLEQAVNAAARVVQPGDIVLLSPGGTSFDEFRDFEERGEAFRRWVHNLSCK